MPPPRCPACDRPAGSNAACLSCRDAAARELAREAEDVTPARVAEAARAAGGFLARPPWWARGASAGLLHRLRLLWMVLRDFVRGRYRLPWRAIAALAAAALYVVAPFDLIPDFLGPVGFTDDGLVVALAMALARKELLAYCTWKGLSPAHFGLEEA
jgi:uncharacterized membrane protein YkvA (DUF1232 family)